MVKEDGVCLVIRYQSVFEGRSWIGIEGNREEVWGKLIDGRLPRVNRLL